MVVYFQNPVFSTEFLWTLQSMRMRQVFSKNNTIPIAFEKQRNDFIKTQIK